MDLFADAKLTHWELWLSLTERDSVLEKNAEAHDLLPSTVCLPASLLHEMVFFKSAFMLVITWEEKNCKNCMFGNKLACIACVVHLNFKSEFLVHPKVYWFLMTLWHMLSRWNPCVVGMLECCCALVNPTYLPGSCTIHKAPTQWKFGKKIPEKSGCMTVVVM